MTIHTSVALPIGLERELRLLAGGIEHPDAVVQYATVCGRYQSELLEGNDKVATLLDLNLERMHKFFEDLCTCSVEVRPTNEYHKCQCHAGRILRRFDRYMAGIVKRQQRAVATATITIG